MNQQRWHASKVQFGMDSSDRKNNIETRLRKELNCSAKCKNRYDGKNTAHPNMATFQARIRTFLSWPSHLVAATAVQIASAGFFYLKVGDKVKCFCCNGGLMDWSRNDNPWFEHAKWFPECEYVLRCKGSDYVEDVKKAFPDLQRPKLLRLETPKEELFISKDLIDQWLSSSITEDVKMLGFEKKDILEVGRRKFMATQKWFESAEELVGALVNYEEEATKSQEISTKNLSSNTTMRFEKMRMSPEEPVPTQNFIPRQQQTTIVPVNGINSPKQKVVKSSACVGGRPSSNSFEVNDHLHQERLADLQEENLCKICLDRPINCVLMNCRHMCCCLECASGIKLCPICRDKMVKIFKFYR